MTEEQEPWLCTILRWISRWKGPPAVVRPSSAPDERAPVGPGAAASGVFAQIVNTSFNDRGKPILRAAPAPIRPSLAQACAPSTDRYAVFPSACLVDFSVRAVPCCACVVLVVPSDPIIIGPILRLQVPLDYHRSSGPQPVEAARGCPN